MVPRPDEDLGSILPSEWTSIPGMKVPKNRERNLHTPLTWICDKRLTDRDADVPPHLWRIHDGLYDLSRWMDKHPGGNEWLEISQGTDITEAFESHHLNGIAEKLLPHFLVRRIETTRATPYTFNENGFYMKLKKKLMTKLKEKPESNCSKDTDLIADILVLGMLITATLAVCYNSYILGIIPGILLAFITVVGHNYIHRKDNFRIFYFELGGSSCRDWRIKHVLSHHLYPNSVLDLEISAIEPIFSWLPKKPKNVFQRYVSWLYSPLIWLSIFHFDYIMRFIFILTRSGHSKFNHAELVPFFIPFFMWTFSPATPLLNIFLMWNWVVMVSSLSFHAIGFNGGHHHPEVFHDGDTPRKDLDWGLAQMDAVRDRKEICQNLFLALTWFGHHLLHHLFPTLDHAILPQFYPILKETLNEFDIKYEYSTLFEMVKGNFRQLARSSINPIAPGEKPYFKKDN